MNIGKTGRWTQGKLNKDDNGELRMAIFEQNGKVIIDFGTELSWIGFDKNQAKELGNLLIKKSK